MPLVGNQEFHRDLLQWLQARIQVQVFSWLEGIRVPPLQLQDARLQIG